MRAPPRTAVVLSGGGARGAYEVGVLRYIREELPKRLGFMPRFDIVCGTSVGAINAAYIAATADEPETQARRLADDWTQLSIGHVYHFTLTEALRAGRLLLGGMPPPARPGELRRGGVLDTRGLETTVVRRIPWRRIRTNIATGFIESLSISTTHIASGNTVVFVEKKGGGLPPWSRDPFVRARAVEIGPLHVLGSAAIPVLFPAVNIDGAFYCDGGLRQNTPLSPALRLGADRVLVISLRHMPTPFESRILGESFEEAYPSPWFVFGKALNALLLDHTDYDLDRLRRTNALIAGGIRAFGDRFVDEMNDVMQALRGGSLRLVRPFLIRPSSDIGVLAASYARTPRLQHVGGILGRVLDYLGGAEGNREADLLSYLLFDGEYASELIELGLRDARARADELAEFFAADAKIDHVERSA